MKLFSPAQRPTGAFSLPGRNSSAGPETAVCASRHAARRNASLTKQSVRSNIRPEALFLRQIQEAPAFGRASHTNMSHFYGTALPGKRALAPLRYIQLPDLLQEALAGRSLFLLAHHAGLFKMLPLLHFRKDSGLFNLLFETAQRDIKIIFAIVKIYSRQDNHLPAFSASD